MDFYEERINALKETISKTADSGTLSHGIMIECENEEQSLDFARYIAQCLVCRGEHKPCNACTDCHKATTNGHPDIIETDGISSKTKTKAFTVDSVREIRSGAFIVPNESDCKVYILKNGHNMNEQAQNAILKILEEPPSFVYFIILTTSKSVMLETVLSRVSLYRIGNETTEISEKDKQLVEELIDALTDGQAGELRLTEYCSAYKKDNQHAKKILEIAQTVFRDALVIKNGFERDFDFNDQAHKLALALSAKSLMNLIEVSDDLIKSVDRNINNNLLMTRISYEMRRAIGR